MTEKENAMKFASDVARAYESIWKEPKYKKVRDKYFRLIAERMDECGIEPTVENVQAIKMMVFKKVIWELCDTHPDFKERALHCVKHAS